MVAALVAADGRVLVNQRLPGTDLAGSWEFPGGKLEPGESAAHALARELDEELGIRPERARPLIRIRHDYPGKRVELEVMRVDRWTGTIRAREGHPLRWSAPAEFETVDLLPADRPIVTALRLPARYAITGEGEPLAGIERLIDRGCSLIQLRAPGRDLREFRALAIDAIALCRIRGATLLLNTDPALARELDADGVHLNAARVAALTARPLARGRWVGASCHDPTELARAVALGCDFAVLGPVAPTTSHRRRPPIGWRGFRTMADCAGLPVFALGGVGDADIETAWENHGQGVAGISAWW